MFHRFSQIAGSLRNATQLEALLPQGLRGAAKDGPVLTATQITYTPNIDKKTELRGSAGELINPLNPHGWKSWRDIPDSMIPTTSARDPDNGIYAYRKYINLRKKQIWVQMQPNVPMYLRFGTSDKVLFYVIIIAIVLDTIFVGNELKKMLYPSKP